jgi:flagellar basal-body rod modification protein FlgD
MTINSTNYTTTSNPSSTESRVPQQTLGQNDFLKLLTVQMTQQDPMKPMEDTAFIAQMAQFTALQQTTEMSKSINQLRNDNQLQAASALIGREVTIAMPNGDVTGVVDEVGNDGDGMHVRVGDVYYPFNLIYRISAVKPETESA